MWLDPQHLSGNLSCMEHIGPYRIVHAIALGGMGEVFLAALTRPGGFEKTVAIKRALPELMRQPAFVELFEREARLAAHLNHRNIVQIFDFGRDPKAGLWLAMEYVSGVDLKTVLDAAEGPILTALAVEIAACCLRGLDYAHTRSTDQHGHPLRLVHRDVSPHNVLLSYQGDIKLTDFGLARATARGGEESGGLRGKFGYLSPEQASGGRVDERSDLYALAVVLYEMLTGKRAFWATDGTEAILRRARNACPLEPIRSAAPNLDPRLAAVVEQAMAAKPEDRYQSADAFRLALLHAAALAGASPGVIELGEWLLKGFPPREVSEPVPIVSERTATAVRPICTPVAQAGVDAILTTEPAGRRISSIHSTQPAGMPIQIVPPPDPVGPPRPRLWPPLAVLALILGVGLSGWVATRQKTPPTNAMPKVPDTPVAAANASLAVDAGVVPDASIKALDAALDATLDIGVAPIADVQGIRKPRRVIARPKRRPVRRLPAKTFKTPPETQPIAATSVKPVIEPPVVQTPRLATVPRVRLRAVGATLRVPGAVQDGWREVPKAGILVRVEGGAGPMTKVRLISRGSHFEALIHATPFGTVYLDGVSKGTTPVARVTLRPGKRRLEVEGPDGQRARLELDVAP